MSPGHLQVCVLSQESQGYLREGGRERKEGGREGGREGEEGGRGRRERGRREGEEGGKGGGREGGGERKGGREGEEGGKGGGREGGGRGGREGGDGDTRNSFCLPVYLAYLLLGLAALIFHYMYKEITISTTSSEVRS